MLLNDSRLWGVWHEGISDLVFCAISRSDFLKYIKLLPVTIRPCLRVVRYDVSKLEI